MNVDLEQTVLSMVDGCASNSAPLFGNNADIGVGNYADVSNSSSCCSGGAGFGKGQQEVTAVTALS